MCRSYAAARPFDLISSVISAPAGRLDGRAPRAVLGRLAARVREARAAVGVDQLALNDVDVSDSDQGAGVLSLQESPGNSTGRHVDALAGVLGDRGVDDHVGDLQADRRDAVRGRTPPACRA